MRISMVRSFGVVVFLLGPLVGVGSLGAAVALFPLSAVRLLEGPLKHAQDLNRDQLLRYEVDRFLVPFRADAGLPVTVPKYPNWESTGLDGHTAGHYLSALANTWAATGDVVIKARLDAMVVGLAECQRANGNGYVGAIPGGRAFWDDVAAGKLDVQTFAINGKWVPWYNEHKLFAGLRDAWLIAGNAQAREVLIALSRWCVGLVDRLSDEQLQTMMRAEHGGMNEVLADVGAITGDPAFIAAAKRFSHRALLDPLLERRDTLTGLHANTQIPKAIGFARIGELTNDAAWLGAGTFFWETVVEHRSVAFGGNSQREHFNATDDFATVLATREGPETCNTYNMLRLTEVLFRSEPRARYADYYERAVFNHILSSQHPEHGGYVYFTPIRPRHYRVYSQLGQCFWCCVGSGMENHGKYGEFLYAHDGDALYVNLYTASELTWAERGLTLRQETRFPDESTSTLVLGLEAPTRFTLRLRHPVWVDAGALTVRVNGAPVAVASTPSSYASLSREWCDGDRVEVELPMRTTLERLPDGSPYAAVLHGPILLAAKTGTEAMPGLVADDSRMGHVAPGPYEALDGAPMLVGDEATVASRIVPVPGKPLTFSARGVIRPEAFAGLELIPFFRLHDARYMTYWRVVAENDYARVVAELETSEKTRLITEARTADRVAPGEQQPEVEHAFAGEATTTGVHLGRTFREAKGWFSYRLLRPAGAAVLRITVDGGHRGASYDLEVDGKVIGTVTQDGRQLDQFVDLEYPLPGDAASVVGPVTVRFVARDKSRVGPIFDVRVLRAP